MTEKQKMQRKIDALYSEAEDLHDEASELEKQAEKLEEELRGTLIDVEIIDSDLSKKIKSFITTNWQKISPKAFQACENHTMGKKLSHDDFQLVRKTLKIDMNIHEEPSSESLAYSSKS